MDSDVDKVQEPIPSIARHEPLLAVHPKEALMLTPSVDNVGFAGSSIVF